MRVSTRVGTQVRTKPASHTCSKGDLQIDRKTQAISSRSFPPHYMVYAPGVSNADIGISRAALKDRFDLPFVYSGYSGGTRAGYIIVLAKGPQTAFNRHGCRRDNLDSMNSPARSVQIGKSRRCVVTLQLPSPSGSTTRIGGREGIASTVRGSPDGPLA